MSKKGRFVAGSHLCWFSRNPQYKQMTCNEVLKINPEYMEWCRLNLEYIRFAVGLRKRIRDKNKKTLTNE